MEVKFPVELIHLVGSDLVLLVGVERRHEDVDLTVSNNLISHAPLDDLPQVLSRDVAFLLGVELIEQFLHTFTEIRLGNHLPFCIDP
jgi:hypothetical protein